MSNNTSFNNIKYFEYSIVMYCTVYNAHMYVINHDGNLIVHSLIIV